MKEFIGVFKEFTNISGRISRRDYIIANLVQLAICIFYSIFAILITKYFEQKWVDDVLTNIYMIYGIFSMIPFFTATVRRLHDTGRSGLYLFWLLLPIIGSIVIYVFLLERTRNEENNYENISKKTKIIVPIIWLLASIVIYFAIFEDEIEYFENLYYISDESNYYGTWGYEEYTNYKASEADSKPGYIFTGYYVDLSQNYFQITYDFNVIERQNDELVKTSETENYATGKLKEQDGKLILIVEDSNITDINVNDQLECSLDENSNFVLYIPSINESYILQ